MGTAAAPKKALGKLLSVDLRDHWQDEARDFTPWLAKDENLRLLGEVIGIPDLQFAGTETKVGPFKADILARDPSTEKYVVIENQLERTNHDHLGKLITYASGLEATAVVWIASKVCDEHRKAIDWLNGLVGESVAFFGLEVELWRIGNSESAPKFNLVCQPNEWAKSIRPSAGNGEVTETKLLQFEFWSAFIDYCKAKGTFFSLRKPNHQHWYDVSIGKTNIHLVLTVNTKTERIGCELYINVERSKDAFRQLHSDKTEIERQLGAQLEWNELPHRHACRIGQFRNGDISDRSQWPELLGWLKERAEIFHKVFSPRAKSLDFESEE
jgi:Domain of unknown function (DUF4268)